VLGADPMIVSLHRNKDDCCNYEQILQLYPDGRRKKKKMTVATGVEIMWISNADERVH